MSAISYQINSEMLNNSNNNHNNNFRSKFRSLAQGYFHRDTDEHRGSVSDFKKNILNKVKFKVLKYSEKIFQKKFALFN